MHRLFLPTQRVALLSVLALSGCATVHSPGPRREESMAERFRQLTDSIDVANSLEEDEVASAPRIRLIVPLTSWASTRWFEPSFSVSDDAYVLVVAVDLDRRVRVLYPTSPEQSGFVAPSRSHRLSRFFAGFGGPRASGYSFAEVATRVSPFGGEGVLLAVASERPLQVERLVGSDGEWDEGTLSDLIFHQSLAGAAQAIGRAVVLTGQEYNTDYATFSGRRMLGTHRALASSSFDDCAYGYGYGYGSLSGGRYGVGDMGAGGTVFLGFHQSGGVTLARYVISGGSCGRPVYYDVPVRTTPVVPRDTVSRDTSTVVMRRPPRFPGAPRFPTVTPDSSRPRMVPRDGDGPVRRRPEPSHVELTRLSVPERRTRETARPEEPMRTRERREAPRAEPERREPMRSEPARSEPARSEPVRSEPVRSEPVRSEPVRSEPVRSEPVRSEPVQREPVRTSPVLPDPR